jgi:hypothetical protein
MLARVLLKHLHPTQYVAELERARPRVVLVQLQFTFRNQEVGKIKGLKSIDFEKSSRRFYA